LDDFCNKDIVKKCLFLSKNFSILILFLYFFKTNLEVAYILQTLKKCFPHQLQNIPKIF